MVAIALGVGVLVAPRLVLAETATEAGHAELRGRLAEILARYHVPGMAVALYQRGDEPASWAVGLGLANVRDRTPATADTPFRVASISKMWLALAILKLQAEGRLSLTDRVTDLVPEVACVNPFEGGAEPRPVRVVHLLESTTGWDDLPLRAFAHDEPRPATLREALDLTASARVSRWPPGTRYAYNNAGPAVSAAIVEKVTGRPYEEHVAATFFAPLGMRTASFLPSDAHPPTRLYQRDGHTEVPYWHMLVRPAAALNASANDMGKALALLVQRGHVGDLELLPRAALERMESTRTGLGAEAGLTTGYGLHSQALQEEGFLWRGHRGGIEGASADLFYLPDLGVGYFFALNSDHDEAFEAVGRALRAHLTRALRPRGSAGPAAGVSAEALARYAGWYEGSYDGWYEPVSPRYERSRPRAVLLDLARVEAIPGGLQVRARAGHPARGRYLAASASPTLLRRPHETTPTLALAGSAEAPVLVTPDTTLRRVPTWAAWLRLGGLGLAALTLASVGLFAAFWIPRALLGRPAAHLHTRVWPLAAALTLVAGIALDGLGTPARLGRPTLWALALTLLSVLYPALSALAVVGIARAPRREIARGVYLHTWAASVVLAGVAIYLAAWGLVGLCTWR